MKGMGRLSRGNKASGKIIERTAFLLYVSDKISQVGQSMEGKVPKVPLERCRHKRGMEKMSKWKIPELLMSVFRRMCSRDRIRRD